MLLGRNHSSRLRSSSEGSPAASVSKDTPEMTSPAPMSKDPVIPGKVVVVGAELVPDTVH